jgi:FkbM family methyltransferase
VNKNLLNPKLLLKLFVDRRRFRGASEFSFRILRGKHDRHRIVISSRQGAFRRTVALRRDTSDLSTFEQIFADTHYNHRRLQRADEISAMYEDMRPHGAPLILDLGANVGLSPLYFAKNWPAAQVIAVEPDSQNFRLLCENTAGNDHIVPVNAAVASEDGAVRICNADEDAWARRTETAAPGGSGSIPALSVASLMKLAPEGSRPFIAKIDIEGFESNLFSQNTSWVDLFPVLYIELHDWMLPGHGTSNNFLRVISQLQRDFILSGENVISISNAAH